MKTRLSIKEAAQLMQASQQFIRVSLQRGLLPFGYVIKQSSQFTYYINVRQFSEYTGIPIDAIERECSE